VTTDRFLSESDWKPFYRYSPPREAGNSSAFRDDHPKTQDTTCWFCGLRETDTNPLQAAHRIPAQAVKDFGLRPEVLSRSDNFVWAHQRLCNKSVELKPEQVMWRLMSLGVKELPAFLPAKTLKIWEEESRGVFALLPQPKTEERHSVTPTIFTNVPPPAPTVRRNPKRQSGVPTPPPGSALREVQPAKPSQFQTVPPPTAVRRRKSSDSETEEVRDV